MPSPLSLLQEHTTLRCRSLDRLYLNAYIPELQRPELVRRFLERATTPIASPALFRQRSERFIADLRGYAEAHTRPDRPERGERKEDRMRPLLSRPVVIQPVAVGAAQSHPGGRHQRPLDQAVYVRLQPDERLREPVLLPPVGP
jgi:hypothetical protein